MGSASGPVHPAHSFLHVDGDWMEVAVEPLWMAGSLHQSPEVLAESLMAAARHEGLLTLVWDMAKGQGFIKRLLKDFSESICTSCTQSVLQALSPVYPPAGVARGCPQQCGHPGGQYGHHGVEATHTFSSCAPCAPWGPLCSRDLGDLDLWREKGPLRRCVLQGRNSVSLHHPSPSSASTSHMPQPLHFLLSWGLPVLSVMPAPQNNNNRMDCCSSSPKNANTAVPLTLSGHLSFIFSPYITFSSGR